MTTPEGVDRALWLTAVHEAGHGVAAAVLGLGLHSVSAVSAKRLGDSAGRAFWNRHGGPWKAAVALLAGPEAVRAAGEITAYAGAGGDMEGALAELAMLPLALGMTLGGPVFGYVAGALGELERARGEAAEIVTQFWPELTVGAAALCRAGTMSGRAFLEAAGGRLAGLAEPGNDEATAADEGPVTAELVPVAECPGCGWELSIPSVAYQAMTGETLADWLAWQRPRLCRSHDEG